MFSRLWNLNNDSCRFAGFSWQSNSFCCCSGIAARECDVKIGLFSVWCKNCDCPNRTRKGGARFDFRCRPVIALKDGGIRSFEMFIGDTSMSHVIAWPRNETVRQAYFVRLAYSVVVSVITVLKVNGASVIRITFPWQDKSVFVSMYVDTKMGLSIMMPTGWMVTVAALFGHP